MAANVKENLLEMKNLSELILDVAYSALFLQDETVAAEVEDMYQDMRTLEDDTLKLVFRVEHLEDEERLVLLDMIDEMKDVAQKARALAQIVEDHKHPTIISDVLEEADERVITVTVKKGSALIGEEISRSHVQDVTGAHLTAVKRGKEYIFDVDKITVEENDELIAVGSHTAAEELRAVAHGDTQDL